MHILGVGFLPYVVLSCPVPCKKQEGESSVGLITVSYAKISLTLTFSSKGTKYGRCSALNSIPAMLGFSAFALRI